MMPRLDVKYMTTNLANTSVPTTVAAGTETYGVVDTKGYDFLKIISVGLCSTVADSMDYYGLYEADTTTITAATDYTAIVGFRGGTDFTANSGSTTMANALVYNVDLRGRKRYIAVRQEQDGTASGLFLAVLGRIEDDSGTEYVSTTTTINAVRTVVNG